MKAWLYSAAASCNESNLSQLLELALTQKVELKWM
jgi:hypothetical protein